MKKIDVQGKNITLRLLSREDLICWKDNYEHFASHIGLQVEAERVEGVLLKAFSLKIANLKEDPGNAVWYSYFGIIYNSTLIGAIGSKGTMDSQGAIEVGYGISEKYRNKGIVTEALQLFSKLFFSLYKVKKIIAQTEKANISSQRVLIKNGFEKIKEEDLQTWVLPAP